LRASTPILLVGLLVLFQCIAAGQNNSAHEAGPNPETTPVSWGAGRTHEFKGYGSELGCGVLLSNAFSRKALEIGRSYAQQLETTSKLINDPAIANYVNRIAQKLTSNLDVPIQLTLKIIAKDKVNAVSLAGGLIFVNSGLILATDNEAELAAVISHEIAHQAACHAEQSMARWEMANVASPPLIFRLLLRRAIRNTIDMDPIRVLEFEADSLAVKYLYWAGYNPHALAWFLAKVRTIEKRHRPDALDDHPALSDRIRRTQQEINTFPPPTSAYQLDTSEFRDFKERLAELAGQKPESR
jgi:beta-barrel assembly-enhancing protease